MSAVRHNLCVIFAAASFVITQRAAAWGNEGHRVVAAIAAAHLSPDASRAVGELLATEPEPTLPGVASWADDIRPQRRETAPWHFANLRGECRYVPERDCPDGQCVVAQIAHFEAVLADPSESAAARREALKFVVHLVGDLHQPLHVNSQQDKGANTFQVQFEGRGTNLHHIWDTEIVNAIDPVWHTVAAQLAGDSGTPVRFTRPEQFDPAHWAEDTCEKVQTQGIYPAGHIIDAGYVDGNKALAQHQLQIAGERLAAVLNMALDP